MTRKAYIVGPNTENSIWNPDASRFVPVEAGQTVWVDLDDYRVDKDGEVRAFASPDAPSQDYGYIKFTDLTPVSEVDDSDLDPEKGYGYVRVDGHSVYLHQNTTPEMLRDEADYYERVVKAHRAVADWLEAREANDPVKKATALLNGFNEHRTNENVAKYLIENGVVFP